MKRDGVIIEIETAAEGMYAAVTVAQIASDRELSRRPAIIDMFVAAETQDADTFPLPLNEDDSRLLFKAIRTKAEAPGDTVEDSTRRLTAFSYLKQLELLGFKSFEAAP